MTKQNITPGQTLQHGNLGTVRVIQVLQKGIRVLQTLGCEGMKTTSEHVVAARDLQT